MITALMHIAAEVVLKEQRKQRGGTFRASPDVGLPGEPGLSLTVRRGDILSTLKSELLGTLLECLCLSPSHVSSVYEVSNMLKTSR